MSARTNKVSARTSTRTKKLSAPVLSLDKERDKESEKEREKEAEGEEREGGNLDPPIKDAADPQTTYRALTHLHPSAAQTRLLIDQVHDTSLWQATLEHWLSHGWNPRNLAGQIELYQRGGPSGCRQCRDPDPAPAAHSERIIRPAHNSTLDVIEKMRKEIREREHKSRNPDT